MCDECVFVGDGSHCVGLNGSALLRRSRRCVEQTELRGRVLEVVEAETVEYQFRRMDPASESTGKEKCLFNPLKSHRWSYHSLN